MKTLLTIAVVTVSAVAQSRPTVQDSFARHVALGGEGVDRAYAIANQWRLDVRKTANCGVKKKYISSERQRVSSSHEMLGSIQGQSPSARSQKSGSVQKSAKPRSGTLPTKSPRPLKVWQRLLLW